MLNHGVGFFFLPIQTAHLGEFLHMVEIVFAHLFDIIVADENGKGTIVFQDNALILCKFFPSFVSQVFEGGSFELNSFETDGFGSD